MDATQLQHLAFFVTHINDAIIDWAQVAKERGISRKDNALCSFKHMLQKHGMEYNDKRFSIIPGFEPAADGLAVSTPKPEKPRTPRKRQSEDGDDNSKEEEASQSTSRRARELQRRSRRRTRKAMPRRTTMTRAIKRGLASAAAQRVSRF